METCARQAALLAAAVWIRTSPGGHCRAQDVTSPAVCTGSALLEVRGCSQRGEVPWKQQDRIDCLRCIERFVRGGCILWCQQCSSRLLIKSSRGAWILRIRFDDQNNEDTGVGVLEEPGKSEEFE